jgi:hypothetical protein
MQGALPDFPSAMHGLCGIPSMVTASSHREPLTQMQPLTIGAWSSQLPTSKNMFPDEQVAAHASDLYVTGELPSPQMFAFSKAKIRIDWRALAGVDIDYVVRCL